MSDLQKINAESELITVKLSPVQIMQQAKAAGLEISEIREMLVLQKDYEANEARKAFHLALSQFKQNPPLIVKDKLNTQYNSNYTSIGNMVNTANEALGEAGLNARWDFPQDSNGQIFCTCILAHKLGHEESVTISAPIDTSGNKNAIQGRKSTRTYLKLETFEAVTGLASVDGNIDDDGKAAGPGNQDIIKTITEEQSLFIHSKIIDNDLDMDMFLKWFKGVVKVDSIDLLPSNFYDWMIGKIDETIKNKRGKVKSIEQHRETIDAVVNFLNAEKYTAAYETYHELSNDEKISINISPTKCKALGIEPPFNTAELKFIKEELGKYSPVHTD